jgi:hypothetical protein
LHAIDCVQQELTYAIAAANHGCYLVRRIVPQQSWEQLNARHNFEQARTFAVAEAGQGGNLIGHVGGDAGALQ